MKLPTEASDGGTTVPAGIWCPELDLGTETVRSRTAPEPSHASVRALVRLRGRTLGYVTIGRPPAQVTAHDLAEAARRAFPAAALTVAADEGAQVVDSPTQAESSGEAAGPRVSLVVCTRNRGEQLVACLNDLRELTYRNLDIIVVDNAPTDDSTRRYVDEASALDPRIRYATEPRPGLSCARNRGLREARGEYIAYTDDDVSVDADWITQLVAAFGDGEKVACVTGLVCTAALTTSAEIYFDARTASWSTRTEPVTYDLDRHALDDALYPYSAGIFGTGANFAFDRAVLVDMGGFDEALGAGTLTRGGEDLDIFVRVLRAGYAIRYDPSAVVWHHHRADEAALVQQMYGYGTGLTAYLAKMLSVRETRNDILRRVPKGLARMAKIKRATDDRLDTAAAPKGAMRRELTGYLAGPYLYARARRRLHRHPA
ncbi:glycosyltransferase [Jatrophihabitans telluris]|uniref:Glycosyltransferase n=1 Tax=Jatrophihabitans telluris TaxID=2038343 RepID=A0ABY4QXL4_9ACTN|nr:glycosyltransferase [Jatrophihabitans telluris]UQX87882.1 glycosyltransferase [Jatrophihabitans telluris]